MSQRIKPAVWALGAALVAMVAGPACIVEVPRLECTNTTHCAVGLQCVEGRCVNPAIDAGVEAEPDAADIGTDADIPDTQDDLDSDGDLDSNDSDTSGTLDPAPGQDDRGPHGCEEGPEVDLPGVFYQVTRTFSTDYFDVSGTVRDALAPGTWYSRMPSGLTMAWSACVASISAWLGVGSPLG